MERWAMKRRIVGDLIYAMVFSQYIFCKVILLRIWH